ncbi:MAG: hypothetical protein IIA70_08220, partial [Proteobacteria bacterium]|nr:hypothetical protein [Pseudomonadota bacterium]
MTEVYSIGNTLRGSSLLVIEITNEATGPADDKPGYYYDGNIHAGELTGSEVALHFAWYLLSNYGNDERVTDLVDTRAIYIRPKFNPDGADLALTSAQTLRSTPRMRWSLKPSSRTCFCTLMTCASEASVFKIPIMSVSPSPEL